MHPMMTALAQINLQIPSDETIQAALNTRSDVLALIAVIVMLVVAGYVARIVGRSVSEQSDALAAERAERQKLQGALETQRLRTTALEDKLDKMQTTHLQAQHDAGLERERWIKRIEEAERKLTEQEKAFNDERTRTNETAARLNGELEKLRFELAEERKGSLALYEENGKLRQERDALLARIDELERRIDELSERVEKRSTDEQMVVEVVAVKESTIDTAPLIDGTVKSSLHKEGD